MKAKQKRRPAGTKIIRKATHGGKRWGGLKSKHGTFKAALEWFRKLKMGKRVGERKDKVQS